MSTNPIGVIDSGVGGLTILKRLTQAFPNEAFIYFGDTKNAPYGEKDIPELKVLTEKMIRFMEEKHVKALVIACNTITASGVLKSISTTIPHIIEIIEPTVQTALISSTSQHFVLLATDVTIKSGLYQRLLKEHVPQATIETYSLPELVRLAEKAEFTSPVAEKVIKQVALTLPEGSTVVLGCTHYPFFTPYFKKHLGKTIRMVDSSQAVTHYLKNILSTKASDNTAGSIEYYVSGNTTLFQDVIAFSLD
jgi:glutamate racemase